MGIRCMDLTVGEQPNLDPKGEFIQSVRVRVSRSVRGYTLPSAITTAQRAALETDVQTALATLTGDLAGTVANILGNIPLGK